MYAVVFELDTESLGLYDEIGALLEEYGFTRQQSGVYFGNEKINAVTCVLAAIEVARSLPWFTAAVREIRMLRIEELNDLMPAVRQG